MGKIKVGVIGLGWGTTHAECYLKHSEAEVVAFADTDSERMADRCQRFGVKKRYAAALDMLDGEDLDVVSVAVPNKFHRDYVLAALAKGCHVLCEKPMAMNAAEAREMVAAAKAADRRLMINYGFRFQDAAWALKRRVDAGVLGDVYYARSAWLRRRGIPMRGWFSSRELAGGGALLDIGVHRLDMALWYMGFPKPVWVAGSTYDMLGKRIMSDLGREFEVDDFATAMVKFDNGATLDLGASWAGNMDKATVMETRVLGTKAGLVQGLGESGGSIGRIISEHGGSMYVEELQEGGNAPGSAMYHLIDCIAKDLPHTATGEEGVFAMEILDALYESSRKGEPVKIDHRVT